MKYLTPKSLLTLLQTNIMRIPTATQISTVKANKTNATEVSLRSYADGCKSQKLLKFPAVQLEDTIHKFLKSIEPLLNEAEYKQTVNIAKEFVENEGNKLQYLLENVAKKEVNWLAERWLKVAYLQFRAPVTVYSSPAMTFPLNKFESDENWCEYTANVVNCLTQFKLIVDNCKLPVVMLGKFELDNSQFGKVFGTNRTPARQEDIMEYNPNSKHAVVIYKGHFFKLPVLTTDCQPIHPKTLKAALLAILKHKQKPAVGYGLLTTDTRDNWAEAYCILKKMPGNDRILSEIQSALFTVGLDDYVDFAEDNALNVLAAQLIHGGGGTNAANRWMDKTIQLVVNRNGMSGFTCEHSPAEGQPIAMMLDFCVTQLQNPEKLFGCQEKELCVEYLRFADANPCIEQWLEVARRNVRKLANSLQINVMHFQEYGKHFIKTQKMSPDSFIQIALQYAFYKMYGVPAAQYETAHLRIYYSGRTETIRSCSTESVCFAKSMLDENVTPMERIEFLRRAVDGHRLYTNMALQGKGVDRHLLGLKLMAIENCMPIPKFFSSPGFVKSTNFRMSTSQVASPNLSFMAYGPLVVDGYGCCYNPRDFDIIFAISNMRDTDETNSEQFGKILHICLMEMKKLLEKAPMSKL